MAELPPGEQALKKLEDQLTCGVCLQPYTRPKVLHCFHIFCEDCLQPLVKQTAQGQTVECPHCRKATPLPTNGVPDLQGAFFMSGYFDVLDILKKASNPNKTKCDKCKQRNSSCFCRTCGFICDNCKEAHATYPEHFSSHNVIGFDQLQVSGDTSNLVPPMKKTLQCPKHPNKELDLFCEKCEEIICRDCIVRLHRDHPYDLVVDTFPKHKAEILASLQPVEQQVISLERALEVLDVRCTQIEQQCHTLETEVHDSFTQVRQVLEAKEKELSNQLQQMKEQKLKILASQREQIELHLIQLNSCQDFVKKSVQSGIEGEILDNKKPVLEQVNRITTSFQPDLLEPREEADLRYIHSISELIESCRQFGQVFSRPVCPDKCQAEGAGLQVAVAGEISTATVHLADWEGRKYHDPTDISCELVSGDGYSKIKAEIQKTSSSSYEISYRPHNKGQYHLHICIGGKHIPKSPFSVPVISTTPTYTITGLNRPWGVAVNRKGQVVVTEHRGNAISIFNSSGEKVKTIGTQGSFTAAVLFGSSTIHPINPSYVALTDMGEILVRDLENHCIKLFSFDGKLLKSIGTKGVKLLQFDAPLGIAIHPQTKKIYITEYANHRVQILNSDFTFSSTFGSQGSGVGNFNCPYAVAFDSTGNVYVADSGNHRVAIFTPNGEFLRDFGKKGDGEGKLNQPVGVAIDSRDMVYVTDWDTDRISIYNSDGDFVTSFGTSGNGPGQFDMPTDIAINKDGKIYVTDFENGRVQIF